MALDKLVDSSQLDGALTSTAEKIKIKTGAASGSKLDWNMTTGFAALIDTILTPTDGTIATKTSSDLQVNGKGVIAPAGYYATDASVNVADGAYSADSSASSNSTVTPSLGLDANATGSYGFTTTQPSSGTTGTNYLTLDPGASATAWSVTPRANITTAGYLTKESKTGTAVSNTPSIAAGTNYYVPIVSVSITGGGLSTTTNTNTVATTPVVTVSSSGTFKDSTDYGVTTTKPSSGTDGTNYLTIDGSGAVTTTGKATSTVKISRAAVTYSNDAGAITSHSGTSAISATDSGNVTKDVNITPTITDNFAPLYIPIVSTTVSGGGLSASTNTNVIATIPVVTVSSSGTFTSATSYGVTTTKPSGTDGTNYLTIDGSGSVTTTGKATSTVKVARAAITYSNSAGAIAAHSETQAIAGTDSGNITKDVSITPTVTDSFSPYYIPIVSASFSGGGLSTTTNTNTVGTAPVVTLASSGTFKSASTYGVTTTKPSGTDGTNYLTITGSGTPTNGKATSTVKVTRAAVTYTNSAGAIVAHSGTTAVDGGNTGDIQKEVTITPTVSGSFGTYYIPVTSVSQGTTTVSGTTATRGTASWAKGAIAAGSIAAASFANVATSGITYVDISSTTAAPVLVSGDYLYINKGYVDNLKISLAKLVPDSVNNVSTFAAAGQILSGYVAFNKDGTGVTGTIATKSASDLSASGKTVTVPAGYYATQATKDVATGSVTPAVNSHTVSTTPVVTGSLSGKGTEIGTTTKPSGTDGTDYWAFTPGGSVTTTGKSTTNAKATVSAGYIASSPANSGNSVIDITPTVSNGTTRYITKATSSVTNGTASATANAGTASIAKNPSASATATANGMDGGYYTDSTTSSYYVDCSASAASGYSTATGGSASASVTASSATVNVGYNPSAVTASTTAASTGNKTGNTATSTEVTASANKKIYLKAAGISWSGGGLSNTTNYSGTPTVSVALAAQTTSGVTITDTAQSSGYYLTLTGSTAKMTGTTTVTRAAYKETRTAGYLPARAETTILGSTTSSPSVTVNAASKTRYICLPTATFAISGASVYCSAGGWVPTGSTSSVLKTIGSGTITNNTTLPSGTSSAGTINRGSYIKIGAGYYSADKYYLAQNVSNGTITNNTTLPSGTTAAGTVNRGSYIKIGAGYYGSDAYYLAQANSGTKAITASGNTDVNGYATASVAAVSGSIGGSASGGSATAAISNVNSMNTISDVSGKTAGTDYWTVKATATGGAGSYTPKYTVSTAGWIASTVTGSAQTVSVSSDSTGKSIYIPKATFAKDGAKVYVSAAGYIPAGSASSPIATIGNGTVVASVSSNSGGSASIAATGFTASSSATSYYVTLSTSAGSVKAKAAGGTAGYVTSSTTNETAATSVSVSGNGTKLYIPAGTVVASVSSNSGGSASMAATGFTASSSATSYYVTLSTSAGSVKAKAVGGTTGIVTSSTTNETAATSVSVSGNGNKLYIPAGAVTASVSSNTGGSASIAATGFTASGTATSYYVTLTTSAGSVKAKAVGSTAGYITTSASNETAATSVAVSGNGNKVYIPAGSASSNITYSGATISTTNNSGVSVTPRHSITAGYIPAATNVNGTTQYINGVTLATASSARTFTVTAPSGGTNHTYTFTQGTDGRTTIKVDNTLTMKWNATDESLDFIYT